MHLRFSSPSTEMDHRVLCWIDGEKKMLDTVRYHTALLEREGGRGRGVKLMQTEEAVELREDEPMV